MFSLVELIYIASSNITKNIRETIYIEANSRLDERRSSQGEWIFLYEDLFLYLQSLNVNMGIGQVLM